MAIPKNLTYDDIVNALQYIDKNGVPPQNESKTHSLILENGKNYPPKYAIAVADYLVNGNDISTRDFISTEAVRVLRNLGFTVVDNKTVFLKAKEEKKRTNPNDEAAAVQDQMQQDRVQQQSPIQYKNKYSDTLLKSKNVIFHGAPGTGKSYLAKQIAADIISEGKTDDYKTLTPEQKKQIEFVQFHPSYDYSDFVEGLRPIINADGTMGFELRDGIFKEFVTRARKNLEDADKPITAIKKTLSVQESIEDFLEDVRLGVDTYKTINNNEFTITGFNDKHIYVSIPGNANINKLCLILDDIREMLESDVQFGKIKDITKFFRKNNNLQAYSYYFAIYHEIKKHQSTTSTITATQEKPKDYVFIIDEINRGEISKIFGELFFAVDPGYRGQDGEVSTQYANLHSDPNEKFYIPKNVYVIGTMNDIDKSVDSFDFAMRRRFRFIEIKADERLGMLDTLGGAIRAEAIARMSALNKAIADVEELGENYQIGAAYFLKLKETGFDFDKLWTDYLQPLLQEYVRGTYDDKSIMKKFEKAYGYNNTPVGNTNEDNPD